MPDGSSRFPPLARRQDSRRICRPDADGQAIAYLYCRDNEGEAQQAKVLASDGAADRHRHPTAAGASWEG